MAETKRIRGLFGGEPRATDEESGLRMRPLEPSFEERKAELASGLLDMSDQAVELPDEDDYLDDVRKSDTIPPGRVTADEVAARAAKLESDPPALPVPLERRSTPALPVPLVRKSAPTLAELGARVPVAPMPANDDERIDLDAIARLARPSDPLEVQMALSSRPPAEQRGDAKRAIGLAGGVVALLGIGFLIARFAFAPAADASTPAAAQPAPAPALPALALDLRTDEPATVELDEVRVESARAQVAVNAAAAPEASATTSTETDRAPELVPSPTASTAAQSPTAAAQSPTTPSANSVASAVSPSAAAPPTPGARTADAVAASAPAPAVTAPIAPAAGTPAADLPATPTRDDVLAALRPIEGQVRTCAQGHYGVVPVRVTVASSGRVTTAVVTGGSVLGTPAGSCIARTVRSARFPAFSQDRFVVDYPFAL